MDENIYSWIIHQVKLTYQL